MFYAPSSHDLEDGQLNKSNEINFKIGIYKEEKPQPKTQNQTRGRSAITLEAPGVSETPNTYQTKNIFIQQYTFDIKIILLNFEPEEEKLEKTFTIQEQIESQPVITNHKEIEKLQQNLAQLKSNINVFQNMIKKMNYKMSEIEQDIESLKLKQNGYIY